MGKKKPNEGTVAWLKQELEKLGVNPEDFKDMRKAQLEKLYSKTSGSGANAGSPTAARRRRRLVRRFGLPTWTGHHIPLRLLVTPLTPARSPAASQPTW